MINLLIIGSNGQLGSELKKKKYLNKFKKITPSKKDLDLNNSKQIQNFFKKNKIDVIINCAAIADMNYCEKFPKIAIKNNINGIFNLMSILKKYKIYLIHISSDAVYPSTKGNYSEKSSLEPYNVYGWTKLAAEYLSRMNTNTLVVRTRFFNCKKIQFKTAPNKIFSSSIKIEKLCVVIEKLIHKKLIGIINVGEKKISNYSLYKKYTKIELDNSLSFTKKIKFKYPVDASLNCLKLQKIINES